MADLLLVPRAIAERKARHGAPCTRCGLCCMVALCELAQHVFHREEPSGPCPALERQGDGFGCGLVAHSIGEHQQAALRLINSGQGCDMHGPNDFDPDYARKMDAHDAATRDELDKAMQTWGIQDVRET